MSKEKIKTKIEDEKLTEEQRIYAASLLTTELGEFTQGDILEVKSTLAYGARDSRHEVFFIQGPKHRNRPRQTFAVKRLRENKAYSELGSIMEANERGFQTLNPVGKGVYKSDIGHFLVTRYMPRLNTMNYLGWRNFIIDQNGYQERAVGPIKRMGQYAAMMHSSGITHGDFQLKNIGVNSKGEFILFDFENGAQFWDQNSLNENESYLSEAAKDIGTIVKSLAYRGFLWRSPDKVFNDEIQKYLFDPYLEKLTTNINNPILLDYLLPQLDIHDKRASERAGFAQRDGLPS